MKEVADFIASTIILADIPDEPQEGILYTGCRQELTTMNIFLHPTISYKSEYAQCQL